MTDKAGIGIGLFLGAIVGAGVFAAVNRPEKNQPFDVNDARAVLEKFKPYSRSRYDTHLTLWGDGTVYFTFKPVGGSELRGHGNSLQDAISDMRAQSELVNRALQ